MASFVPFSDDAGNAGNTAPLPPVADLAADLVIKKKLTKHTSTTPICKSTILTPEVETY